MNDLIAHENLLAQIFSDLSQQRDGGNTYLIEHGLARDRIEEVQFLVGQRAERYQFKKQAWKDYPFSACVAITEVGYEYLGIGTDFWPMVESAINIEIPIPQRAVISNMFRECAKRVGTVRPFDDAWSSAFPHIAWPIRNAMVPREVHAPLARLVREFLSQTGSMSVTRAALPGLRELAHGFGSRRLETWLQDDELALSVIGHLVTGWTGDLSKEPGFMQRLVADLRSESEVRRLERVIRARQLALHEGLDSLPKATYGLLLDDAEARGLAVRGPCFTPAEIEAVRSELDIPLSHISVTVGARSTTLERFLNGDAVFIGRPMSDVPQPKVIGLDAPEWLNAVVIPDHGLLFWDEGDDGYQTQLRRTDRVTLGSSFYELVLEGLASDEWGGGLYHFVSGTQQGDAVLARHGVHVEAEPPIDFLGGLTLQYDTKVVTQASGRPIQARGRTTIAIVGERLDQPESREFRLEGDRWHQLPMTEGIWTLSSIENPQALSINLLFRDIEPPAPATLSLQPEGIGISDMARGAGALHIMTPVTLHDFDIDFTLESSDGQSKSVHIRASASPTMIAFDRPEFSEFRAAARLWAGGGINARLRAYASSLDARSWILTAPEPEWKYDRRSGKWTGVGQEPVDSLVSDPVKSCTTFQLSSPFSSSSSSGYGLLRPSGSSDGALQSCVVEEPAAGTILEGLPRLAADPIARHARTQNDSCGLTNGLDAFLSWSLASAETVVGEVIRSSACRCVEEHLVAALCGDLWMKTEKSCRGLDESFHQRLVAEGIRAGLVCDTTAFSPLNEDEKLELTNFLEERFRNALPAPDLIVIPDGEMWPEMDDAVIDAWERLSEKAINAGASELEFDAGNADGGWQKVVERARDAARLPELTALLLPSERAASLERVPYESSNFDDLIAALISNHFDVKAHSDRWISPADLRTLLHLFLAPERVMDDPDWRGRLLRFGADRFAARAVRYVALRYRAMINAGLS